LNLTMPEFPESKKPKENPKDDLWEQYRKATTPNPDAATKKSLRELLVDVAERGTKPSVPSKTEEWFKQQVWWWRYIRQASLLPPDANSERAVEILTKDFGIDQIQVEFLEVTMLRVQQYAPTRPVKAC